MNFDTLQTLLDYHYWARDRVLDAAERLTAEQLTRDLGNSFPSVLVRALEGGVAADDARSDNVSRRRQHPRGLEGP
jgi:hypothetical protein